MAKKLIGLFDGNGEIDAKAIVDFVKQSAAEAESDDAHEQNDDEQ